MPVKKQMRTLHIFTLSMNKAILKQQFCDFIEPRYIYQMQFNKISNQVFESEEGKRKR